MSYGYDVNERDNTPSITCQEDYDCYSATYTCFACGCILDTLPNGKTDPSTTEYVTLPDGTVTPVCLGQHTCHHDNGKFIPSFRDKEYIKDLCDTLAKYASTSRYMELLCNRLMTECHDWQYPCYTCYTEY